MSVILRPGDAHPPEEPRKSSEPKAPSGPPSNIPTDLTKGFEEAKLEEPAETGKETKPGIFSSIRKALPSVSTDRLPSVSISGLWRSLKKTVQNLMKDAADKHQPKPHLMDKTTAEKFLLTPGNDRFYVVLRKPQGEIDMNTRTVAYKKGNEVKFVDVTFNPSEKKGDIYDAEVGILGADAASMSELVQKFLTSQDVKADLLSESTFGDIQQSQQDRKKEAETFQAHFSNTFESRKRGQEEVGEFWRRAGLQAPSPSTPQTEASRVSSRSSARQGAEGEPIAPEAEAPPAAEPKGQVEESSPAVKFNDIKSARDALRGLKDGEVEFYTTVKQGIVHAVYYHQNHEVKSLVITSSELQKAEVSTVEEYMRKTHPNLKQLKEGDLHT